jgi:hypothetical protein
MRRLCTESSCSYSRRSVRGGGVGCGEDTSGVYWSTKVQAPERLPIPASETGSGAATRTARRAATRARDRTEVSRGNSSCGGLHERPKRRRAEHGHKEESWTARAWRRTRPGEPFAGAGSCNQPCLWVNAVLARRRVSHVHEPPGADPHAVAVWEGRVRNPPRPD